MIQCSKPAATRARDAILHGLGQWHGLLPSNDIECQTVDVQNHSLRTLVRIISSTPRVFLSGCRKARFAGNSGAIAKNSNAAAAAQEQPNVEIILTRVLTIRGVLGECGMVLGLGIVLGQLSSGQAWGDQQAG